jgi:hypothetical protein
MKKLFCIALLAATLSLSACSVPYIDTLIGMLPALREVAATEETAAPPETKTISVVLDITGSTDSAFAAGVRDALSQKVASLVPPTPENEEDGVAAVNEYRIHIKLIESSNANVYSETLKSMSFEISAVPELGKRPDLTEKGATDEYIQAYSDWKRAAEEWSEKYAAGLQQAESAARQIAQIDVTPKTSGNVSGIISTVISALNATTGADVSLGIFSDLIENGETATLVAPTEVSGNVVIVAPAPDGDLAAAAARIDEFDRLLQGFGFSPAKVFDAQNIKDSVNFLFE